MGIFAPRRVSGFRWAAAIISAATACGEEDPAGVAFRVDDLGCTDFTRHVQVGNAVGKDAIPSLVNPPLVEPGSRGTEYLEPEDRVIGLWSDGEAIAVPLNITWFHEIVNLEFQGGPLAVTHCPLTGSSLAFDRSTLEGAELGVSGLLIRNNLIMYDRRANESLWPQMSPIARCGVAEGDRLTAVPVVEMTWEAWLEAHPDTRVVSSHTGHNIDYTEYPYGLYDVIDNRRLIIPMPIDPRRPPKERVLAVPEGDGGIAFPFLELERLGPKAVVEVRPAPGGDVPLGQRVVFWDDAAKAAAAFLGKLDGRTLTFRVEAGSFVDEETGSVWGVDGRAISGPLEGRRLTGVRESYVAYWFAWAAFVPETEVWTLS